MQNTNLTAYTIRIFDVLISLACLFFAWPLLLLLAVIGFFDTGAPFFRQERLGRFQKPFFLVKFRTMRVGTINIATHLVDSDAITRFGRFMRRTKIDELPQLWNVLKGDMSLVGPRPCLLNQDQLIAERSMRGIYLVRPGITGLAQINHIDMSTPVLLAEVDAKMLEKFTLREYYRILLATILGRGSGDRVRSSR
jgi:O-antigen biosynthesis protein WbqP